MQANPNNSTSNKLIWGFVPLWFIQLAVVGIVGFLVYYFFFRVPKYGKDVKVEDTDGDGKPDDFNATPFTDRLKADLIGLAVTPHDIALHSEVLAMSDGRLHAIYDDWKNRIAPTISGESLPKAIADESSLWDGNFSQYQDMYKSRFQKLNLV